MTVQEAARYIVNPDVSCREEGPDGARWLEIPNATMNAVNMMAAGGLGIAAVSVVIILLARVVRGQ